VTVVLALVALAGAGLIVVGTAMLHEAAGYIVAGGFLLAAALLVDVDSLGTGGGS